MKCKSCNLRFQVRWFGQKTCSKSCESKYREEKPKKEINKISDKRQIEEDIYYKIVRPKYLDENPYCVRCKDNGAKKLADQIHHKNGREGKRLNDKEWFMSVCKFCHEKIHLNPLEAREKGYLI